MGETPLSVAALLLQESAANVCGTGAIHPLEGLAVLAATSLSTVLAFAMLILNLTALPYVNSDTKP
jgi:hypothetical protein